MAIIVGAGAIGFYRFDQQSGMPEQVAQQFPVLNHPFDALNQSGQSLVQMVEITTQSAASLSETAQGLQETQQRISNFQAEHPVIAGSLQWLGQAAGWLWQNGKQLTSQVSGFQFSGVEIKETRQDASHKLNALNQALQTKQQELEQTRQQINQLQQDIDSVEKAAKPVQSWLDKSGKAVRQGLAQPVAKVEQIEKREATACLTSPMKNSEYCQPKPRQ